VTPERQHQTHGADRYRGVRDVEGPEPHVTHPDVDEVNHAVTRTDAVEQVADRATNDDGHAVRGQFGHAGEVGGGAIGNLLDRIRSRDGVVDFIVARNSTTTITTLKAAKIQRDAGPRCMPNAAPGL